MSLSRISEITSRQHEYRSKCLNMIASEVVTSPTVRKFLTSDFGCRYGNYNDDPKLRGYKGNKIIIELEEEAHRLAKEVFSAKYVDLRPLGGESADAGVIFALTKPGDTVFETGPGYGGQMAATRIQGVTDHGGGPPLTRGQFNVEYFPYDIKTHQIDIDKTEKMIKEKKPSLLIIGRAQILFSPEPVKEIKEIAEEVDACVAYDGSHIFGLMAGKRFMNPLDHGADLMMGSHTKTFPGPQGGMTFTNDEETFEKLQGGKGGRFCGSFICNHHMNRICSLAVALAEMKEFGEDYADQVLRNSAALGKELDDLGFDVLYPEYGYSQTHMVMLDLTDFGGGAENADYLQAANILCSAQSIPIDFERGTSRSGLRIGTQELTRTSMKEEDMSDVAKFYKRVLMEQDLPENTKKDVAEFVSKFNKLSFSFDDGINPYEPI